jgi:hypothetical protein
VIPLLLTAVYACCLVGLAAYALLELHLAWIHRRLRSGCAVPPRAADESLPRVTVQIPLFNERHVAERVLGCVSRFDYPRDKLEIQVLDDSTDDTPALVRAVLAPLAAARFDVVHIRRPSRDGYKAGALRDALPRATGELIAILDADFCPAPDMLRTAVKRLAEPRVAVVQLRWTFLNERYSMLTRLQAVLLRMHFGVEQPARTAAGLFANFNGSGGVWRRAAIEDAGGWHADTLTEDLDLSYRAQLKGWRVVYLEHEPCDCELPVDMDGFRSQQHRWMKGGAENARLHLARVIASPLPLRVKVHACAHLLASTLYVLTLGLVLSATGSALLDDPAARAVAGRYGTNLSLSTLALLAVFYEAQGRRGGAALLRFLPMMLAFLVFTLGMALHNALAALAGWFGRRSEFVRTPKYGIVGRSGDWASTGYASAKLGSIVWLELALLAFIGAGLASGWRRGDFSAFAVGVPAFAGATWIVGLSFWHAARARATHEAPLPLPREHLKEAPGAAR